MTASRFTVLLASPNGPLAEACETHLAQRHSDVLRARSAQEILRILGDAHVDAVILDVELPGVALSFLPLIMAAAGRRDLPLLLLQNNDSRELRATAYAMGADDVLLSPLDVEDLVQRLERRVLRIARGRAAEGGAGTHTKGAQTAVLEELRRAVRYDDALALCLVQLSDGAAFHEAEQIVRHASRDTDLCDAESPPILRTLLPKTHPSGALTVAQRISRTLTERSIVHAIGIAAHPLYLAREAVQLVRAAELALNDAAQSGENRISILLTPTPNDVGQPLSK